VRFDLSDTLRLPFESAECVVHIAGEKRDTSKMWAVNVDGTDRMLAWSRDHSVKRFVLLSSVGVYGAKRNAGVVTETTPHNPRNVYEQTKDTAERRALQFCHDHDIECVVLQPSNVIGAHNPTVMPLVGFIRAIARGMLVQFGSDAWTNYVCVEDVAHALVVACTDPNCTGTYILNQDIPLVEVVQTVASGLGVPVPRYRLPRAAGVLLGEVGHLLERVSGRSLPMNRERVRDLSNSTRYDGARFVAATRFRYTVGVHSTLVALAERYVAAGIL